MNNKKYLWPVAIVVVLVVAIFGLVSLQGKKGAGNLKVGAVLPLTGFGSLYGSEINNGLELCSNGKIDFVVEDSQTDPKVGVTAFSKLNNVDKADVIITAMSGVVDATIPLKKDYKGVVIATSVSSENVAQRGGQDFYRYFTRGGKEAELSAKYLYEKLNVKKLGVLYANSEFGKTYLTGLENYYKSAGENVISEAFAQGSTDFRTQILKLKNAGVEGVYLAGFDKDVFEILKEMKELNYKPQIFTNWVLANPQIYKGHEDLLEGVYLTTPNYYFAGKDTEFYKSYSQKYSKEPTIYASLGCDIAKQLVSAGSDAKGYFRNLKSFDGLNGSINVDSDGEMEIKLYVGKFEKGQINIEK